MENANGRGRVRRSVRSAARKGTDLLRSDPKVSPQIPKLVLIMWLDACHEFGWQDGNEDVDSEIVPCLTIGWLLSKTKSSVKVCQTWSPDNHAQTIVIPSGMIQRMEELPLPKGDAGATEGK